MSGSPVNNTLTRDRARLVVVSNRIPRQTALDAEGRRTVAVGGLVSALQAALEEHGGLWLGWSGETVGQGRTSSPEVVQAGPFQIASLDLPKTDSNLFYNVFSNRTLWPLLHSFPEKAVIRHDAYRAYSRINQRYAEGLFPLLNPGDLVWVQDYHLIPLGSELRKLGWEGKIGFFLHTPFPPQELFSIMPWAHSLLESFLAYDLAGFHSSRYAANLLDSLSHELGGQVSGDTYRRNGSSLVVKAVPIGINPEAFRELGAQGMSSAAARSIWRLAPHQRIILGVDRLDYTKGITQRLMAFEYLLEHYPSVRGQVTMVQISAPSRSRVPEYVEERQQVDQIAGRINGRFTEAGWTPIQYLYRSYPQAELAAFYRAADVCLVTPLRDGMNLIAKEFVVSQGDDPGVLVLSKFCGAAETMKEALLVNPYDIRGTADAMHQALRMGRRERLHRWSSLVQGVESFTADDWRNTFLSELVGRHEPAIAAD